MTDQPHPPAPIGPHPYLMIGGPRDGDTGTMCMHSPRVVVGIHDAEVYENTGRRDGIRTIFQHIPDHPAKDQYTSLF